MNKKCGNCANKTRRSDPGQAQICGRPFGRYKALVNDDDPACYLWEVGYYYYVDEDGQVQRREDV
jgi:hypothetical protein